MIDQVTHGILDMPTQPHEITIMIINTGQKCTMSYSDRMCVSNRPNLEKIWRTKTS